MAPASRTRRRSEPALDGGDLADPGVLDELERLHRADFGYESGQILGSMCTAPHPLAVQAHLLFLSSNLGDPGHFPGAKAIEDRYLRRLLALAGSPEGQGGGQATSGGSEANILALALLREGTGRNEVIVPATGHFSLEKAAKLMKMKLRVADVDDRYRVRPESVAELVGPRTAGILGIAGSTQVGSVDPLRALGEIASDHDVPFHVDAAFGGYVLPFREPAGPFGFDVPGVTSATLDSHKMGMSTLGAGALLVADASDLDVLAVETPYLSAPRQRGVLGTRSGAPFAGAWALLEGLGPTGYRRVVERCLTTTRHLVRRLGARGLKPLVPPELNIVALPVPQPERVQAALTGLGWRVNVLPRLGALRIVCMPHVTPEIVDAFVPDLAHVLDSEGGARRAAKVLAPAR
jgi:tyrosine decarboxylase / aspartate 1-decarboxylase